MKAKQNRRRSREDEDTMRPEYDFSKGVRGKHATRYAEGSHLGLMSTTGYNETQMTDQPRTICSVADLAEAAIELMREREKSFWWRGHADSGWKLVPGAFREDRGAGYERNIFARFRANAPSRHDKCPPYDQVAEWLFLMRHYGLCTRLLDWTESPLAAAFFAVSEHPKKSATIWALDPYTLNDHYWKEFALLPPSQIPEMFKASLTGEMLPRVAAVPPVQIDLRLLLQLAAFTIHGDKQPLEESGIASKCLFKFHIPSERKRVLEDQLYYFGVRRSSLFGDLENLAHELNALRFND